MNIIKFSILVLLNLIESVLKLISDFFHFYSLCVDFQNKDNSGKLVFLIFVGDICITFISFYEYLTKYIERVKLTRILIFLQKVLSFIFKMSPEKNRYPYFCGIWIFEELGHICSARNKRKQKLKQFN